MKNLLTSHDISALVSEYNKEVIVSISKEDNIINEDECESKVDDNVTNNNSTNTGGLIGMYLENIYDVDKKTLVLKLKYKNVRKYLLLESGQRMHTIEKFSATGSGVPKSFCVKIRKHIRDRRIVSIKQINHDRVVDIQFGRDDSEPFHIILEFYASGNIILTDKNYVILDLVHYHSYNDCMSSEEIKNDKEDTRVLVRPSYVYPFDQACAKATDHDIDSESVKEWFETTLLNSTTKKKLKECIMSSPFKNYSPVLIEHAFYLQGISIKQKVGSDVTFNAEMFVSELKRVMTVFDHDGIDLVSVKSQDNNVANFILNESGYYPYKYSHLVITENIKYFETFDLTVREFYTKMRGNTEVRENPDKKVTKKEKKTNSDRTEEIVSSIKSRIDEIQTKKNNLMKVINCCQTNSAYIDTILNHIMNRYKLGNKITSDELINTFSNSELTITIKSIDYADKTVTFEDFEDFEENDAEKKRIEFTLDWTINVNKNIRNNYSDTKVINNKIIKSTLVMNDIEKKSIKEQRNKEDVLKVDINRKQLWFERFNWFLSSDDMMVVSGKDAKSNEYLVKNIMKEYDLYVHSDCPGSGSCIILNPEKLSSELIPNRTKEEAGMFVVAHTKTWDTNVPDSSFWVNSDQVSRTPETGEYIKTGSFVIRGKRNYMTKSSFIMGLCVLFWNGNVLTRSSDFDTKFAVISCAPYTSTSNCAYRKKIVPGTGKINKSIEAVVRVFCEKANENKKIISNTGTNHDSNELIPDKMYIKNIPLNDWHVVCPGRIKVM